MRKQSRENKITILLNDSEMRALNRFCERYGVQNRSKLIREALMKAILKKMDSDQPTLFDNT